MTTSPNKQPALPQRKRLRLRGFDYATAGYYFVTVCAFGRRCIFGRLAAETMQLSDCGRIVQDCWNELPRHFSGVETDAFVVMPNHIHGIVCLSTQEPGAMNRAPTLGDVMRSFKARCSGASEKSALIARKSLWQRGYHEHVVRNDADLARIREYSTNNPLHWSMDRENPDFIVPDGLPGVVVR